MISNVMAKWSGISVVYLVNFKPVSKPKINLLFPHKCSIPQWSPQQYKEYSNLRSLIRYHALKAELLNTEAELQIMRPMGKGGGGGETSAVDHQGKPAFVKNGLNPDKWFLQVHYLKVRFCWIKHRANLFSEFFVGFYMCQRLSFH